MITAKNQLVCCVVIGVLAAGLCVFYLIFNRDGPLSETDEVDEALIKYLIHTDTNLRTYGQVFVTIDGHNPSGRFLDKCDGKLLRVYRGSSYSPDSGFLLSIVHFSSVNDEMIDVRCSMFFSSRKASQKWWRPVESRVVKDYTLKRVNGMWRVCNVEMVFVTCS